VTPYQKEQAEGLTTVKKHLESLSETEKKKLKGLVADYLTYRKKVGTFLSDHFKQVCTRKCFMSRLSACCSRDGIITFFADMVINTLISDNVQLSSLAAVKRKTRTG